MPDTDFIQLFGRADDLSQTANVIREIADDIGHGRTPSASLLAEIHDLALVLASLQHLAAPAAA